MSVNARELRQQFVDNINAELGDGGVLWAGHGARVGPPGGVGVCMVTHAPGTGCVGIGGFVVTAEEALEIAHAIIDRLAH